MTVASFGAEELKQTLIPSGFGPYSLSRLCSETGGMYFISDDSPRAVTWPRHVMLRYAPDYRHLKKYAPEMKLSPCKQSLVEAASLSQKQRAAVPLLPVVFGADTDEVFREQLAAAQKLAAVETSNVDELLTVLKKGLDDRPTVVEPRWSAAYDVSVGRSLAMKARMIGYNRMLAEMRGSPQAFQSKESDQWTLEPLTENSPSKSVKTIEERALSYLHVCAVEHPDTPWARLALRDINMPSGWKWKEVAANSRKPDAERPENAKPQAMPSTAVRVRPAL